MNGFDWLGWDLGRPLISKDAHLLVMIGLDAQKPMTAMRHRHGGRFNIGFCDGHIETLKPSTLFARTDQALQRWNNDHEPHPELVAKVP